MLLCICIIVRESMAQQTSHVNRKKMKHSITLTKMEQVVIDLLMRKDGLSRYEISQQLHTNAGTVARVVNRLINKQCLRENEEPIATAGRPKQPLNLNPDIGCVVGIDLEATSIRGVIIDFSLNIITRLRYPLKLGCRPRTAVNGIVRMHRELMAGAGRKRILGFGLGIPGPCDVTSGRIISYSENPAWAGFPVAETLAGDFGLEAVTEQNIIANVLGENWFQFRGGIDNLICVFIRAGVGASFIINGSVYRGDKGITGEIAHLQVRAGGEICECGRRGCLRQYASARTLLNKMKQAGLSTDGKSQTLLYLAQMAVNRNPQALKLVRKAGQSLGCAIGHIINTLGIEQVIVNSDLNNAGDLFLSPMLSEVKQVVPQDGIVAPSILLSTLDGYAGALGAAILALRKVCRI